MVYYRSVKRSYKVADYHERDPGRFSAEVPDCSSCIIAEELMGYLEYMQGSDSRELDSPITTDDDRFRLTKAQRERLRSILRTSPDLGAFAIEMQRLNICPMAMVTQENPNTVAQLVSVGQCPSFDKEYRPGIQIIQE